MSPGSVGRHSTGFGFPVVESSKVRDGKCVLAGFLPPVASATAQSIASRAWSFWVETVNSLNVGFFGAFFFQKHPSTLPSEVAIAGILGYLAMAAERTFWVRAGSQLVTSKGCSPMNLYLCVGSRILWSPWFSSTPWLLPFGPLSIRMLPPFGKTRLIHLPQFSPAWEKGVSMKTL